MNYYPGHGFISSIAKLAFSATIYHTCKERNARIFKQSYKAARELFYQICAERKGRISASKLKYSNLTRDQQNPKKTLPWSFRTSLYIPWYSLLKQAFPSRLLFPLQEVNPDPHPHLLNSRLIQQEPFFQLLLGHIFFLGKAMKSPGKHSQKGKPTGQPHHRKDLNSQES